MFNAYDKMHGTRTLSLPFPQFLLPPDTTILRPRLTCEVRITDTDNYYELKFRLCADGFRMVVGINFDSSYAPVIDGESLLLMIAVATSRDMKFHFLDISNVFQNNIIHTPSKRHYLHFLLSTWNGSASASQTTPLANTKIHQSISSFKLSVVFKARKMLAMSGTNS